MGKHLSNKIASFTRGAPSVAAAAPAAALMSTIYLLILLPSDQADSPPAAPATNLTADLRLSLLQ